jgi:dTDP-glucose 4,6-dehydratase
MGDQMKNLLVTGGCGFIGSNFIRLMLEKYPDIKIINLDKLTYAGNPDNLKDVEDNPNYAFVKGDICDPGIVRAAMKKADTVVHFAAESHVDRSIEDGSVFVRTNVLGTNTLLQAAHEQGIKRFLHVSTDEVYGSIATGSFRETDILTPSSPYSASKAASDLLALSYHTTHKFPVMVTRCTNNYGPCQFPEKLIPLFVTNLLQGKKVPVYGSGLNVRDWIYVLDHCKAIDFVLDNGNEGEIYNIGGGAERTNLEITGSILKLLDKGDDMIKYVRDRPGHRTDQLPHVFVIVGSGNQVLVIRGSNGSTMATLSGVTASALLALDWNGDGKAEVVIGDLTQRKVFVIKGSASLSGGAALFDRADEIISGENQPDQFGYSLAGGDLAGDGALDLIIGSRTHVVGDHPLHFEDAGAVYVLYGTGSVPRKLYLPLVER